LIAGETGLIMPSLMHRADRGQSFMQTLPVRLVPGDDLRNTLEALSRNEALGSAFVLQGIGSLSVANLRYAGIDQATLLDRDLEILTLAGSLGPDGAHLHMSVSDSAGRVYGGHVSPGCIVRTTAEILLASLDGFRFSREVDSATGFPELSVHRQP
jgi:predicted DNA-binding protein with PD1-like motif